MSVRVRWFDPRRYLRPRKVVALEQVVEQLVEHARGLVGTPGPPASSPGDPPHADSGALRDGIIGGVSPDGARAMLGTNVPYGVMLELGTPRVAPRPWMVRSAAELSGRLRFREIR